MAINIDKQKLRALMRLKPTLEDTAAFFECDKRTIQRFIHDEFGKTFRDFCDENMVHTRFNLVRKAISLAENGNVTMLIFCLKNLCDWRDKKPDEEKNQGGPVGGVVLSDEQMQSLLRAARGLKAV